MEFGMRSEQYNNSDTAPLNVWIYYKGDDDKILRVQGGVFVDRWVSPEVMHQLKNFVANGLLDGNENWIPGNRIVRVEYIGGSIDVRPQSDGEIVVVGREKL
jgi:hypothetical protein